MAICYFLGVKCVTSKKNGQKFYPATFLTRNNFRDWETQTRFCADETVYEKVSNECSPGDPVVCSLDMAGNLMTCVPHDTVPALPIEQEQTLGVIGVPGDSGGTDSKSAKK